jgi:hypothetical protein
MSEPIRSGVVTSTKQIINEVRSKTFRTGPNVYVTVSFNPFLFATALAEAGHTCGSYAKENGMLSQTVSLWYLGKSVPSPTSAAAIMSTSIGPALVAKGGLAVMGRSPE